MNWTQEELKKLQKLRQNGGSFKNIANTLNRSISSVKGQYTRMNNTEDKLIKTYTSEEIAENRARLLSGIKKERKKTG